MKITIDTKEDSHQEIQKVIKMLSSLVGQEVMSNQRDLFDDSTSSSDILVDDSSKTESPDIFGDDTGNAGDDTGSAGDSSDSSSSGGGMFNMFSSDSGSSASPDDAPEGTQETTEDSEEEKKDDDIGISGVEEYH